MAEETCSQCILNEMQGYMNDIYEICTTLDLPLDIIASKECS